jgi:hypothetical protein
MPVKGRAKAARLARRLVAIGILPAGALLASGCNALFGIDALEPLASVGDAGGDGGGGCAAVEVALGLAHSCARKNDGSLWCWGRRLDRG